MSGRSSLFGGCVALATLLFASTLLTAQQWKEIPVGYNMPKSAMASAPASPTAFPQAPQAPKSSRYSGEGRDSNRPWEIEVHGGGFFNADTGGGQAVALPSGTSFFGGNSKQVSSYMFGDGNVLFNQVAAATGISSRITHLDPILRQQFAKRNSGAAIGVRFGRDIASHLNLEFSADWSTSALGLSDDSKLINLQNTATTFQNGFADLFTNSCLCRNTVVAIPSVRRSEGSQLFWTGAVNVYLKTSGKALPYVTLGGGGVSNLGPTPHAGIYGQYSFIAGGAPHNEIDVVNIEGSQPRTQGLGIAGIGVKYFATSRWGLRLDLRDFVSPKQDHTLLSATPTVLTLAPPQVIGPPTTPTLVFSNDPSLGPSSLSGPALHRMRTFNGDGIDNQVNLSVGVFYRF